MKAVVIGGCGHIGTYLVPMLVNAGYDVVSVSRGVRKPYVENPAWNRVEKVVLDRKEDQDFVQKIAAMNADIVVDLICFTVDEVKAIVEPLKNTRLSHYLFCSSAWAHGKAKNVLLDPNDPKKEPIDEYGKQKFLSELYLKEQYRINGFPATIVMPGHISGPGWTIINPVGNSDVGIFQKIARGEKIYLPNLGMETLNHVHAEDVAQVFFKAIQNRNQALGECFHAVAEDALTLYGYAKIMYEFFNKEEQIDYLPWDKWCEQLGDEDLALQTYRHIARSGKYSIENGRRLIGYQPKYSIRETVEMSIQSYVDRGVITI